MRFEDITPTEIRGCGKIITDVYRGTKPDGNEHFNFLIRTEDNNIVRLQFWDDTFEKFSQKAGTDDIKGLRIGFKGRLSGVYQEKPTIAVSIEQVRFA